MTRDTKNGGYVIGGEQTTRDAPSDGRQPGLIVVRGVVAVPERVWVWWVCVIMRRTMLTRPGRIYHV
jgi:hypothetical protein